MSELDRCWVREAQAPSPTDVDDAPPNEGGADESDRCEENDPASMIATSDRVSNQPARGSNARRIPPAMNATPRGTALCVMEAIPVPSTKTGASNANTSRCVSSACNFMGSESGDFGHTAGEDVGTGGWFAGDGGPGGEDALGGAGGVEEGAAFEGVEHGAGGHGADDQGMKC